MSGVASRGEVHAVRTLRHLRRVLRSHEEMHHMSTDCDVQNEQKYRGDNFVSTTAGQLGKVRTAYIVCGWT